MCLETLKMCNAKIQHQDSGWIKSRHRKNQGRQHRNRLQISGHTTKHTEQTERGQKQSNKNLQKRLRQILKSRLNAKNKIQDINHGSRKGRHGGQGSPLGFEIWRLSFDKEKWNFTTFGSTWKNVYCYLWKNPLVAALSWKKICPTPMPSVYTQCQQSLTQQE